MKLPRRFCFTPDALIFAALIFCSVATGAQAPNPTPAPPQPAQQQPAQQGGQQPTAQETPPSNPAQETKPPANKPVEPPTPKDKAWGILREGLREDSVEKRAKAVNALGILTGNAEAEKAALDALKSDKPAVRLAGAGALGSMHATGANGALEKALEDPEPIVVLAAANSLLLLKDDAGYDVYFAVLTGEKRASKGLIKEQLDTLKDKKKMAEMGFEEGIGFIPFAGIGYTIVKTVMKDDGSPVRAAAAKKLAHDPDPSSGDALVSATQDKNWAVRAAALEAIAQRGDSSLLPEITAAMDDDKDVVRNTAAACVIRLSDLPAKKPANKIPAKKVAPKAAR
jgi:HEAT repeat protein